MVSSRVQFAINEMVRVLKPNGYLAAYELIQYSDRRLLNFSSLFSQSGLREVHVNEVHIGDGEVGEYLYQKLLHV